MRYFTSDSHFGHTNIIKYCNRPFVNAGEMNRVLMENWNTTVKPEDTVYHLGDVAFASPDVIKNIITNLNGYKILILGNHDRKANRMTEYGFQEVHQSLQIELENGIKANLSHYPYAGSTEDKFARKFETKSLKDDGRLLINGHVHTSWKFKSGQFKNYMINVGVDQWDFKPISEPDLLAYLQTLTQLSN